MLYYLYLISLILFVSGHFTSDNNFKILDSCQPFDLRILESIYIHKIKPSLNDHASSVELSILK